MVICEGGGAVSLAYNSDKYRSPDIVIDLCYAVKVFHRVSLSSHGIIRELEFNEKDNFCVSPQTLSKKYFHVLFCLPHKFLAVNTTTTSILVLFP